MKKKLAKQQKLNLIFFIIEILLLIVSLTFIYFSVRSDYLFNFDYKPLKDFSKDLATFCEVCFFIAISLFIGRFIIKNTAPKGLINIKNFIKERLKLNVDIKLSPKTQNYLNVFLKYFRKLIMFSCKILQKLHVPVALLGVSIIVIHAYIFLHLGFKFSIEYILGILGLVVLSVLLISGFLRIFNKNIKFHKDIGIIFIAIMILHILFG